MQNTVTLSVEGVAGTPLPEEAIDHYVSGRVGRDELLDYLAAYPYVKPEPSDDPEYDMLDPQEFGVVVLAVDTGKLTESDYADLYARRHGGRS
ncbi:hypothetical protein HDA30_000302 [Micrococcus cohnii]|uniref:Uncharacterized protein n=1 Tax=Micrococcus cohnii TaxID=993416 RepID=A0A7W7M2D0_9MICC|nr:hypothetical protein [Micrococcus cohnii]MBB4734794.1 hypothetical protein [Micrococcus cohnii]